MKLKITSLFIALFCLAACTNSTPAPLQEREIITMLFQAESGSGELSAYLAQSDEEKAQGLMFVKKLPKDYGMIFVYDEMHTPRFWMKNMQLSLDFIFLDDQGVVVDIMKNIPPCMEENDFYCERYQPKEPSQYVLEVSEGWVEEVGVEVGDGFELDQRFL